jgi:hypothetical protein
MDCKSILKTTRNGPGEMARIRLHTGYAAYPRRPGNLIRKTKTENENFRFYLLQGIQNFAKNKC